MNISILRNAAQIHTDFGQVDIFENNTLKNLEFLKTCAISLLQGLTSLPIRADGRFFEVSLSQAFLEYGLWQDYGTGRETPRGNSGDLGRTKIRQRRRRFSRKYYASVMNIKEFFADNLGKEYQGIIADYPRK